MSIQDLLYKVKREDTNNSKELVKEITVIEENKKTLECKNIEKLLFHELLEYYAELRSWLETHEYQNGTDKLDVNDRPFDEELWISKLKVLESVATEIFTRPLTDGLAEQIKKYGL